MNDTAQNSNTPQPGGTQPTPPKPGLFKAWLARILAGVALVGAFILGLFIRSKSRQFGNTFGQPKVGEVDTQGQAARVTSERISDDIGRLGDQSQVVAGQIDASAGRVSESKDIATGIESDIATAKSQLSAIADTTAAIDSILGDQGSTK